MRRRFLIAIISAIFLPLPVPADHGGGSPVHPASSTDDTFRADSGPGLDTRCTFREDGPLEIELPIDRFYGEVSSVGTLLKRRAFIDKGYMPRRMILRMPAFDVDSEANQRGTRRPEVDEVWFNDHQIGILSGRNNTWVLNEFEIPLDLILFPERGDLGEGPEPRVNEIRIEIDTANSDEVWCTAIDWVQIEILGPAPILLVHGINANPGTWSRVDRLLELEGLPFESEIRLGRSDTVDANAELLAELLPDITTSFGVRDVHVIAHSKGSLDMRRYLHTFSSPEVNVLSLFMLDSPHHGSILADLSVENRTNPSLESADPELEDYLEVDDILRFLGQGPSLPGLRDLTVGAANTFNTVSPGTGGPTGFTFGSDADLDDDGVIQAEELEGFFSCPGFVTDLCARVGNLSYRILRDVGGLQLTEETRALGLIRYTDVQPIPTTAPRLNDLVVTDRSSRLLGAFHFGPRDANHSTIKDRPAARLILELIRSEFPVN